MISGSRAASRQVRDPVRARLQRRRRSRRSPARTSLCGPIEAALANGMLAHSDETDDTHPPSQSHPGCSVVPAALAVGEKIRHRRARASCAPSRSATTSARASPPRSASCNTWSASHRSTHAISGTFGSAAAAGCAASLNAQQMRWLLSYTAQQASGPRLLAARHRSHREGVRLRRHAGPQRRHRGAARPGRRHRRRRHPLAEPTTSSRPSCRRTIRRC